MGTTFIKCDDNGDDVTMLMNVMQDYHQPLVAEGVTVSILMAFAPEDKNGHATRPAITHGGYAAAAVAKVNTLKDRALGISDATITIDGQGWARRSKDERIALLDHELQHLELKTKEGVICRDDLQRPQLRTRKHDYQVGWFIDIARRHGQNSPEKQQALRIVEESGQYFFDFETQQ